MSDTSCYVAGLQVILCDEGRARKNDAIVWLTAFAQCGIGAHG